MLRLHVPLCCVAVLAGVWLAGCRRPPALDEPVAAQNAATFQQWRGRISERLTSPELQALDTAVQELRLGLMAEGVSGVEAIDEAIRARVDGKPVRSLLRMGYEMKLRRLVDQQSAVEAFREQNKQLTTRPGDTESADYLERKRAQQTAKRDAIERDIAATRAELKEVGIGVVPPPRAPKAPADEKEVVRNPDVAPTLLRK